MGVVFTDHIHHRVSQNGNRIMFLQITLSHFEKLTVSHAKNLDFDVFQGSWKRRRIPGTIILDLTWAPPKNSDKRRNHNDVGKSYAVRIQNESWKPWIWNQYL